MELPEAVFFDVDETLVDNRGIAAAVVDTCQAVAAEDTSLDPMVIREANAQAFATLWRANEQRWLIGGMSGKELSRLAWRATLRLCRPNDSEKLASFAYETFTRLVESRMRRFDDVDAVLEQVRRSGIRTAAITNSASDIQRRVLRVLALDGMLDEMVISGEVGIAKPDPGIFAIAIKRLGVDPAGTWHVGDSLALDVAGAKAAGLRAVWLNRTGTARRDDDPEPDWEIASLAELLPFISEKFEHPAHS